jgi:hypothetical protein
MMSDLKIHAAARVQLIVEISLADCWGSDCTVSQVYEQAASAALGVIRNLANPAVAAEAVRRLKIIGEIFVTG